MNFVRVLFFFKNIGSDIYCKLNIKHLPLVVSRLSSYPPIHETSSLNLGLSSFWVSSWILALTLKESTLFSLITSILFCEISTSECWYTYYIKLSIKSLTFLCPWASDLYLNQAKIKSNLHWMIFVFMHQPGQKVAYVGQLLRKYLPNKLMVIVSRLNIIAPM